MRVRHHAAACGRGTAESRRKAQNKSIDGSPSIPAGPGASDFRVVWQGNGDGDPRSWNTYYRRSTDGGVTWDEITRISDRTGGAPYKHRSGYTFPYGDYLSLSVDGDGANHVIWGEGASYDGPGGS